MEKGKGAHFKGKGLNEIELKHEVYYSSESEDESKPTSQTWKSSEEVEEHLPPSISKAKTSMMISTRPVPTKGKTYTLEASFFIIHHCICFRPTPMD